MTPEQLQRARQVDLGKFLLSINIPLKKEGKRYRHHLKSGLIITDNAFYDNITGEHGNAIDYLVKYEDYSTKEAIEELSKFAKLLPLKKIMTTPKNPISAFNWEDIKKTSDIRRSIAYLTKTRGISANTVQMLIKNNLLFQEQGTNNALFPILDEQGEIVGAESIGTLTYKRFKGILFGTKYGYGFTLSNNVDKITYCLFFESVVDLLSFYDISKANGKALRGCLLVSLAGLKENIYKSTLERQNSPVQPVLCVDNDKAGKDFVKRLKSKNKSILERYPPPQYKDWNKFLLNEKDP